MWALAFFTEGCKARIEIVNSIGILDFIYKFAKDSNKILYVPSLKIIGNFSSGN